MLYPAVAACVVVGGGLIAVALRRRSRRRAFKPFTDDHVVAPLPSLTTRVGTRTAGGLTAGSVVESPLQMMEMSSPTPMAPVGGAAAAPHGGFAQLVEEAMDKI